MLCSRVLCSFFRFQVGLRTGVVRTHWYTHISIRIYEWVQKCDTDYITVCNGIACVCVRVRLFLIQRPIMLAIVNYWWPNMIYIWISILMLEWCVQSTHSCLPSISYIFFLFSLRKIKKTQLCMLFDPIDRKFAISCISRYFFSSNVNACVDVDSIYLLFHEIPFGVRKRFLRVRNWL